MDTRLYPVGKGGPKSRYINGTLVFDSGPLFPGVTHSKRVRATIAEVNAGLTLVAAVPGYKLRLVDVAVIAVGGAVGTADGVLVKGTAAASPVDLLTAATVALTQSAVLRAGATNADVLANGASFAALDTNTAITGIKSGGDIDTATHIDFLIDYSIEAA